MAYQWRIIMFPWDVNPMNIMNWDLVLCWHFKVGGEHPCKCSALGCNSRNGSWNQHEPTQNWKWERDWEENAADAAAMEPIVNGQSSLRCESTSLRWHPALSASRPLLHLPWYKTASNAESKDADPKGPVYLSCQVEQPLDDDDDDS